jgi:hypothetical protein
MRRKEKVRSEMKGNKRKRTKRRIRKVGRGRRQIRSWRRETGGRKNLMKIR